MTRAPLALHVRPVLAADARALVPLEPDPAQRALDLLDRLGVLARLVGVLDAQHEAAAVVARVEPREERRAHAADVQQTGWRRRKPRADRAGHGAGLGRGRRIRRSAGLIPASADRLLTVLLGAHVSSAGGIYEAVGRATELGCRSLQVFPQSPRVWKPAVHPDEDLARFRELAAEAGLVAVCHAPYLINLAGTDDLTVERSEAVLAQALRTAPRLRARWP